MLAINEILQKRYRIVRQLGQGGMGAVYEAIDERFGEPIALKEILSEPVNEKQKAMFFRAFEREAKSLAKAKHEAVPYVRDYFSELDRQFLVMELVEGDDLADLLESRKSAFPLEDVLQWLDQLLDALDYLHNLTPPIIHRDIKPQNLKLGYRRKIKLLDFGIAKNTDAGVATTTNQTFVGATLNYSPTEQILRVIDPTFREFILSKHKEKAERVLSQTTDARCDIYSLGATVYHLLTNQLPVDSVKRTLETWEDKPDPLPSPFRLNPNIPVPVSACLMKALELERDNRFATAVEMQTALQEAIKQAADEEKTKPVSGLSDKERLPVTLGKPLETSPAESEFETATPTATGETLSSDTLPLPTQPSIVVLSETDVSNEFRSTEPLISSIPGVSRETATGHEEIEPDKKPRFSWTLPLVALSILVVGAGGTFWMLGPSTANSGNSIVNTAAPSPAATPAIETGVVSTDQTPAVENADQTAPLTAVPPKPGASETGQTSTRPVTPNVKTPVPKPTARPNIRAAQTPKPKPKSSTTIGPCALTDDCK